jgi:hypothetical protein
LILVLLWTLVFTLAYAQDPLFTSNQNQYFLHGLAQAGVGNLSEDWLANTLDPTPVFSGLVGFTSRILPWEGVFYLYFGVLAGIYLYSLSGIAGQLSGGRRERFWRWLYLAILVAIHSAGVRYIIAQVMGPSWDYLLDGGVAGQRILGAVLQPSTFGVLLLLSINLFLRRRIVWAIVCLLLAPTIHPTYLLSAGVLTAVYMGLGYWESREFRRPLWIGGVALLGVTPILVYTYLVFSPTSPEIGLAARELLVSDRIPHHAVVAQWFDAAAILKVAFVLLALYLLRGKRLFHIILWPFLTVVVLTVIQAISGSFTLALLFPWRLSVFLVPLSVSTIAAHLLDFGLGGISGRAQNGENFPWQRISLVASFSIAIVLAGVGLYKSRVNLQEKVTTPERGMLAYVKAHKNQREVYLIPIKMQDFRLVTGAPAYVDFKAIPYLDLEVLEWQRRLSLATRFYRPAGEQIDCAILDVLSLKERVTHLVLEEDHGGRACPGLEKEYQDEYFGVYALKTP